MGHASGEPWRYLRPVKSGRVPQRIVVLDTETRADLSASKPGESILRFALAHCQLFRLIQGEYRRKYAQTIETIEGTWHVISGWLHSKIETWIIAHNLAFDLTTLHFWDLMEQGKFSTERIAEKNDDSCEGGEVDADAGQGFLVLSDPPTIIDGWLNGKPVVMVDWFNYYRQSLSEIAESIGMVKTAMPSESDGIDALDAYCRNDVDILAASVIGTITAWKNEVDAPWGYTGPALAWNAFRRNHLKEKQILIHRDYAALEVERLAYYGGEVRNGYKGLVVNDGGQDGSAWYDAEDHNWVRSGAVFCLDTNSLYPYIMSSHHLPCRMIGPVSPGRLSEIDRDYPDRQMCAVVRIRSNARTYPVRVDKTTFDPLLREAYEPDGSFDRSVGRVLHAYGNFWTALCGEELHRAIRCGDIEDAKRAWVYHAEPFLKGFADEFYQRRLDESRKGNSAGSKFYKLVITSLHGKFGQTSGGWTDSPAHGPAVLWGQWVETVRGTRRVEMYRSLGGRVQRLDSKREHAKSLPIVSAAIASAGRCTMEDHRSRLGNHEFLYQDTDSIHCTERGYHRFADAGLLNGTRLGALRLVRVGTYCRYLGQKMYKVNSHWTHPGIPKSATAVDIDTFSFPKFGGIASAIATNPPGDVRVVEVQKRIGVQMLSGRMIEGGTVVPHEVRDY